MPLQVNNEIYRQIGHAWWDDDRGEFATLRYFVNPIRFAYVSRVLAGRLTRTVLDVGCGGGILAEEFARAGFEVTGIDPAPETIETARAHAAGSGMTIAYQTGSGEDLPFAAASFDVVACCDVLEHVEDLDRVIGEAARVLKPGGLFLYDTINRTFLSKIAMIKVMQEWRSTAFVAPNAHVWSRFIRPSELAALLAAHGLDNHEMRGISTRASPISTLRNFRRRARGEITFRELGRRLEFDESGDLRVSYMGYAEKLI